MARSSAQALGRHPGQGPDVEGEFGPAGNEGQRLAAVEGRADGDRRASLAQLVGRMAEPEMVVQPGQQAARHQTCVDHRNAVADAGVHPGASDPDPHAAVAARDQRDRVPSRLHAARLGDQHGIGAHAFVLDQVADAVDRLVLLVGGERQDGPPAETHAARGGRGEPVDQRGAGTLHVGRAEAEQGPVRDHGAVRVTVPPVQVPRRLGVEVAVQHQGRPVAGCAVAADQAGTLIARSGHLEVAEAELPEPLTGHFGGRALVARRVGRWRLDQPARQLDEVVPVAVHEPERGGPRLPDRGQRRRLTIPRCTWRRSP